MSWIEKKDDCIIVNIRVVPRASKDGIAGVMGDEALKIRIQAPPVEGKANAYLIKYLSNQWKVPRSSLEILSGETGRNKRLLIQAPPDGLLNDLRTLSNN